jgi:hypothetical protein
MSDVRGRDGESMRPEQAGGLGHVVEKRKKSSQKSGGVRTGVYDARKSRPKNSCNKALIFPV